ncbi:MAG: LamB/YcsF family protein [Deltaproteobacteria bacterium]|nr:LamB/YcsF family protein [Deltaproteobacteria bacterium]
MSVVDLNADLGESFGAYSLGADAELVGSITSANVACGFHAGDPRVMARTVALCAGAGVSVGAHPGTPDLQGFGRRSLEVEPGAAYEWVLYQVGALDAFARAAGTRLRHVKPHGYLYNLAAVDERVAEEISRAVRDYDPDLILMALSGSVQEKAGRAAGLSVAREAFVERAYLSDGTLAPRKLAGAVIRDPEAAAQRAVALCREGRLPALDGGEVELTADSFCIHGDSPGAAEFARTVRSALGSAGVRIAPLPEVLARAGLGG